MWNVLLHFDCWSCWPKVGDFCHGARGTQWGRIVGINKTLDNLQRMPTSTACWSDVYSCDKPHYSEERIQKWKTDEMHLACRIKEWTNAPEYSSIDNSSGKEMSHEMSPTRKFSRNYSPSMHITWHISLFELQRRQHMRNFNNSSVPRNFNNSSVSTRRYKCVRWFFCTHLLWTAINVAVI